MHSPDDPRAPGGDEPPGHKQRGPFVARCDAAKYAWCRCERSARYPYCDGSHRGSEVTPIKVVFDAPCTVRWCACGATRTPPWCDGTHATLS